MDKKYLTWLFLGLLILSLFLREIPYINLYTANTLWIFYGLLLLFLVFSLTALHLNTTILILISELLLLGGLLLTLAKFPKFAEIFGMFAYFLLWPIVILAIIDYLKSMRT